MEPFTNNPPATFETVWAALQETAKRQEETAKRQEETDRQMKETDRKMREVFGEMGSWSNNHGRFAEEYFFNSFKKGRKNFFGENFNEITKNLKGTESKDEFDIVMLNGHSVGLVEVKFKAHENDIPKVLKKAHAFRINFPKYQDHKVYLGLATMAFYPRLEEECITNGIAVIKQVGDTVVVNDAHLRVF
jgi:hypothetical protein